MLVLNRKVGERIVVPECKLVLTVMRVKDKTARIRVSAPGDCEVYREEVWLRVREERSQHVSQVKATNKHSRLK